MSVGIHDTTDELLATVQGYVDDGYVRIKLKIEPGTDIEQVAAVRDLIGPDTPFQVDANTAYRRTDGAHLRRLDDYDLLLIEQPLPEHDIIGHARLAAEVATPICLDESLVSAAGTADAIELGACEIANIKPGRVGGYLEAVRIHDLCVAKGIPVWCGGMLETGIGRAANAVLAALPGFTLPGDISASTRFYAQDIVTDPITITDGHVTVPTTPGLGFDLDWRSRPVTSSRSVDHGYSPGTMTHPFLSEEWMTEAKAIREKYADQVPAVTAVIRINQVVTDVPFGDGEVRSYIDTSSGSMSMELGELADADATITTDYDTAKALFVDQDQAATMQAFMIGQDQGAGRHDEDHGDADGHPVERDHRQDLRGDQGDHRLVRSAGRSRAARQVGASGPSASARPATVQRPAARRSRPSPTTAPA